MIQINLNSIVSSISSIHLSVNSAKSKYMFFSLNPSSLPNYPTFKVFDKSIEHVNTFRYLGLIFSSKLSWADHILHISKKARRLIGMIYRHLNNSCSSPTLLTLYSTIVHPILEYCAIIWDPSSSIYSSTLESVQCFALKVVSKSWSSSYSSLYYPN